MKNICFVNTTNFWGGGEKIHLDYALEFEKRGYNVYIAAHAVNRLFQKSKEYGLKTFDLRFKNLSLLNRLKLIKAYRFFKKFNIDTVICSTSHDTKGGCVTAMWAGVRNRVLYRALAAPVKDSTLNRFLYSKAVTHLIANSKETKRLMIEDMNVISGEKVKVIYQGLDIQKIKVREPIEFNQSDDTIIIGNAGRLTEQKRQYLLIHIAKHLQAKNLNFKILIAGTGKLEALLEKQIQENGLGDYVQLLGFVENIGEFMTSIDIFALTSEWEGFGYVLAEAMIAQKPIVAFDISSNPELVIEEKNGFLVPFGDTDQFANRLLKLSEEEELRNRFGSWGNEFVHSNFEITKIIDQFESYLTGK